MLLKNFKILKYILLVSFVLNFIIPITSFATVEDSIYVWSNNSSSVSTATTPSEEIESTTQNNSRKFFRHYFRWCYINGPKNWNYII